jgi:tetratricopeptide (TPR) repeat protein
VLRTGAALRMARSHPDRAEHYLLEATRADPWAVEPWARLAVQAHGRWQQTGQPEALHLFESSARTVAELAPHASTPWWQSGEGYLGAFLKTRQREYLEKALAAYRQAVKLYPTSAAYQGTLALVLRQAGDEAGFDEHRKTALWLDAITPHENRKLPVELRKSLQRNTSGSN